MAMLMGVLVIAFPVSVFSDLWSKELRLHEVFDDREDDVLERKDGDPEPGRGDSLRNRLQYVMLPEADHQRQASFDSLLSNKFNPSILISDEAHVIMTKEDLNNLMNHVSEIHESLRQIKGILRKCKLH